MNLQMQSCIFHLYSNSRPGLTEQRLGIDLKNESHYNPLCAQLGIDSYFGASKNGSILGCYCRNMSSYTTKSDPLTSKHGWPRNEEETTRVVLKNDVILNLVSRNTTLINYHKYVVYRVVFRLT